MKEYDNTIDGNFLSPTIFNTLNNLIKNISNNRKNINSVFFILEPSHKKNRVHVSVEINNAKHSFNVQNNYVEKYDIAPSTIRYQLLGFYILDIIEIEPTREYLRIVEKNKITMEIEVNINKFYELFEDLEDEEIDSFNISSYIFKQRLIEKSFSYKLLNNKIDDDKKTIINLTYNRYYWKEKKENYYIKFKNDKLRKYIVTLYDGTYGNIKK